MVETDWREILSFSQRELGRADKEKLCESLSWMEVDDIELNFSDLKTLFRLSQDILKYKSEQVNSLLGKLETLNKKSRKKKHKNYTESPASTDSVLETIDHQEELIKANKEILEQLYTDIADLEVRKTKLKRGKDVQEDSDSSRDILSEMNAVVQLENEVAMKNRHIRKLLMDIKNKEEENIIFKEKTSVLKDKLTEATELIDNLTEQLLQLNNDCTHLKEILGKSEQEKSKLSSEIGALRKDFIEKESLSENIYEEIKSKVQHWKNIAKTKKTEAESLYNENEKLKEDLAKVSKSSSPKSVKTTEELKIKELQEKLSEASNEIDESASLINILRIQNRQLKSIVEEMQDYSISENRNESDEGKERILIDKLKKKVKKLSIDLQKAENMVSVRERELAETASELKLMQTDEGVNALLGGLKNKKRELKIKDVGIKSLVQEINKYSDQVNNLQLENETLRQTYNVPTNETIHTNGVMKQFRMLEYNNSQLFKELRSLENKLVLIEIDNHQLNKTNVKLRKILKFDKYDSQKLDKIMNENDTDGDDNMPRDSGGESLIRIPDQDKVQLQSAIENQVTVGNEAEMKAIAEENEGLRKGLQEILDFLKDNSTSSSGILALECPSLEALLRSMEARHTAGWFAPHMATIIELRQAIGGKDALLKALHEARNETYEVMTQLSKETKKSLDLEKQLQDIEIKDKNVVDENSSSHCEFGSWIAEKDQINVDVDDEEQFKQMIAKGNDIYEGQLKKGLEYFHHKLKSLYDKITYMAVQAADDQNKWALQEEQYKALIENLRGQIQQRDDEDISENSPGLISLPSPIYLKRKCSYLEESYQYIRTLNENIKNENMEVKKEVLSLSSEYETKIQRLILSIANLTDKLRNSVPIELFWKQTNHLNEYVTKYRKVIENTVKNQNGSLNLSGCLEKYKLEVFNNTRGEFNDIAEPKHKPTDDLLADIEESVMKKQLHELCIKLNGKEKEIVCLEERFAELQKAQSKIIDNTLASITKPDLDLLKCQLQSLVDENKILKEKSQHIGTQLDVALLQLQENQHRQMSNDMEVNILRHQVIDLQSTSDNKAIVARLSGEVLVAHLQVTESNKKIERLTAAINKEKELRAEAEEMLNARQKVFDVYCFRYESKFKYIFEVMQVLRQQYHGSVPLTSIENHLIKLEDISRNSKIANEKLQEIEDLRSNLMTKHSLIDQILDVSRNKCIIEGDSCSHKIRNKMMKSTHTFETNYLHNKLKILEQSRDELTKRYTYLEKTLILVNQGFDKTKMDNTIVNRNNSDGEINVSYLELEDIQSDEDSLSRKSKTITLPNPQVLKPYMKNNVDNTDMSTSPQTNLQAFTENKKVEKSQIVNVEVQTIPQEKQTSQVAVQTVEDRAIEELKENIQSMNKHLQRQGKELAEALSLVQQRTQENLTLNTEKINLETNNQTLKSNNDYKERLNEKLRIDFDEIRSELETLKALKIIESGKQQEKVTNENKSLLVALKQLENDKNVVAAEYKLLLNNEREEYSKTLKDLNVKNMELQSKLDRKGSDSNGINTEALKEVVSKYNMKIVKLEDKCFKLQSELDECKTELTTYQSEVARWKVLAAERLVKMEQLNAQFGERHCQEVESYKAENQHWLSQLNDTQREHMELRSRLTEQKALYVKLLADKDGQMEHMRSVVNNLKTQVINMQTMISVNDPSFDLSAVVEVDEASDAMSQQGSERLEIKFDCSGEINDNMNDDFGRIGNSSTTIWQEPVIERLRRDKQLAGKQNAILRRQIKALASRERRSRLDAQNLRNQVFRISTTGSKVATAETAALHNKIASLQAQLTSARRDSSSSVALWDKWKRAQQAADRWQARFEEKSQETKKLEASLNLSKSAINRLEREKRVLISKLSQEKSDNQLPIEKQDIEDDEKSRRATECASWQRAPPLSEHAWLERVQAQQRRIAALQLAQLGNEHLVSNYEKALAENTSLKGQVLKLESTVLESQIRTPYMENKDSQPELEYWKNYCEMLKEENVQLNLRSNASEIPTTGVRHRINDLEQTILTLRGLVSKLQAEQKSSSVHRKPESRPNSGRSSLEKSRAQPDSHRIEIANLKRSLQEKDLLLERSKEMLKIAAEREDDLLRENALLRRQLEDLTNPKQGFLSA